MLTGGGGDDVIVGQDGNDELGGGEGSDYLAPGLGDDSVAGDAGLDAISYFDAATSIAANLDLGIASGEGGDTIATVESLVGSSYADTLTGDESQNVLMGLEGNDVITAAAGDDLLDGGVGTDSGNGGIGSDLCESIESPTSCELGNTTANSAELTSGPGFAPGITAPYGSPMRTPRGPRRRPCIRTIQPGEVRSRIRSAPSETRHAPRKVHSHASLQGDDRGGLVDREGP